VTCSVHTFQVYTRFVGQRNTYTVDDARSKTLIVAVAVWASAARRLTAIAREAAPAATAAAALIVPGFVLCWLAKDMKRME
jgi:hypothetical protein